MSNAYPSVPVQPPRDASDGCASGQPVPGSALGQPALRPTTVTHVQYPPAPVAGVPVHGQGYGGFHLGNYAMRHPPGQGGQQLRMPDGTTMVITEEAGSMTHVIVRSYARAVRLFAIVDSLIIILYVISGFFYAAVALLGPVCGYHGAKNYVRTQTLMYVVFCFVNLSWRTAVFVMARSVTSQILGFLMVMVEVYITRLAVQFYKFIKEFSEEDLRMLRQMDSVPARVVYW